MAKNNKKEEFATEQFVNKLDKTAFDVETFVENNAKVIVGILVALIVAALGYFAYSKFVVEPKSDEALQNMVQAERLFDQDSISQALKGSAGAYQGLQAIVDEYGNTEAGNLARFKAASSYYKLGDYASAVKLLEEFSTNDEVMLAQKYGMLGNALTQSNKIEEALPYFVKAAEATEVEALEVTYYTKAGEIAMSVGKNDEALKYFEKVADKYPGSNNGTAEKFVERLKYSVGAN
ncbi:tetratricopeptide repeat protein [Faecalibacter rhinopitheci]|uniref:Tetratricopeptide repeat protein n=1 Tax=Faecalibacter rhinopitheci TaxID=2779678 RepID=A0A8J7K4M0_9FLAO|nr:tetratricopeptide repeat protein [Faecalibacter rhinopitheci]MBF0597578.1 tetratricopeptide repeat protein [Faecalibacter rhinopitheci]